LPLAPPHRPERGLEQSRAQRGCLVIPLAQPPTGIAVPPTGITASPTGITEPLDTIAKPPTGITQHIVSCHTSVAHALQTPPAATFPANLSR
jgi:hypothetical protein